MVFYPLAAGSGDTVSTASRGGLRAGPEAGSPIAFERRVFIISAQMSSNRAHPKPLLTGVAMRSLAIIALLVFVGCGPAHTPQHRQPDTASMVFYGGHGPAIIVIVDGFPLGSLPFGELTRFSVAPGEHALWAKSEATAADSPLKRRTAPSTGSTERPSPSHCPS